MSTDRTDADDAGDGFSLATRLRALDDVDLGSVIAAREIRPGGIKDFFDLADAILERASVQQQLARLDRATLAALASVAELGGPSHSLDEVAALLGLYGDAPNPSELEGRLATAARLLLADLDGDRVTIYDCVSEQLRSWPAFGLPGLVSLAAGPPLSALDPISHTDRRAVDRVAAERAFAATTETTELLAELEREPARELAKGGIALPDTKRLANAMAVDLGSVPRLLAIADNAKLVAREAGLWLITDAGGAWLLESSGERWRSLASGWLRQLPGHVRSVLGERSHTLWGVGLRRFVEWLYPAGGEVIADRISTYTQAAELLGITANQEPSGPGSLLFTDGPDAAAHAMAALLPREVEKVYLQHDLSIVATGPLTPRIDNRLRSLADVESRALASSYRVSASSMNRAMAAGETAATVTKFLTGISLTGVPQPLAYLIAEASARYGLMRVGDTVEAEPNLAEAGFRSYLRSDDDALLGTVAVDQNLSMLGLTRVDGSRLASRLPLETVFWNLSDARYPVAAENAAGGIIALRRRRHARSAPVLEADPIGELVERLRVGSEDAPGEAEEAWLARQLDTAIRAKAALTVSVTMPNGSVIDYQLEPASIAGGRLRARDRRSAIERTLPLSSIARISPPADE